MEGFQLYPWVCPRTNAQRLLLIFFRASESIISSGVLSVPPVLAGESIKIDIPGLQFVFYDNSEWWVTLSLKTISSTIWASSGYEVAWSQFPLNHTASYKMHPLFKPINYSTYTKTRSISQLKTTDYAFEFDKGAAKNKKWCVRRDDLLDDGGGPRLTFWRAPTDNDIPHDAEVWKLFGVDSMQQQVRSVDCNFEDGGVLKIIVNRWVSPPVLAWGFDTRTVYTVHGDGAIGIHILAVPRGSSPNTLPRFGLELGLVKKSTTVEWFGRGPGESYNDKKEAARIGVWTSSIDGMMTNYEFPQENGNRTDTRWVYLTRDSGTGLRAILNSEKSIQETGFDFNVQRFSAQEFQEAKHPYELGMSDRVLFRIDGGHHGLGSAGCGPGTLGIYQLPCKMLDFTVDLTPI